ncbi:MAG: nuclear transport factor 2 family protein [Gallionella sp.]|nr:nuclear transport factor 2 family protein [Gallionella sp.]
MDFEQLLKRLANAIEVGDAEALAGCFTPDGIYEDYFFGAKQGPRGLREMLDHFYAGARNFRWEFFQPVCSGDQGYASYRFSYESLQPQALGRRVGFDGICCIDLRDGLISHYREVFDRGMALAQQDFAPERIARVASKHAAALRQKPEWVAHFSLGAESPG